MCVEGKVLALFVLIILFNTINWLRDNFNKWSNYKQPSCHRLLHASNNNKNNSATIANSKASALTHNDGAQSECGQRVPLFILFYGCKWLLLARRNVLGARIATYKAYIRRSCQQNDWAACMLITLVGKWTAFSYNGARRTHTDAHFTARPLWDCTWRTLYMRRHDK